MKIGELTHRQHVGLVALMEAVAISDGRVSDGEGGEIGEVAEALGEEAYRSLLDEAEEQCSDVDALKALLAGIAEQDARELIYGTVMAEVMAEPAADHAAPELLAWLGEVWGVQVNIDDSDNGTARA